MVNLKPHMRMYGAPFLVAIALAATLSLGASALSDVEQGQALRPFDPPTLVEQDAAHQIALADPQVQESLSGHHAFLGASLHTEKLPGIPIHEYPRLLDVWFYDYTSDHVVWAVVDPAAATVGLVTTDPVFQPPLASVELTRAVALAFQIDATRDRFPEGPPPATAILINGEGTVCPQSRCALIGFIEGDGPAMDFLVLVNLSEDRVMDVAPPKDTWQEVYRA